MRSFSFHVVALVALLMLNACANEPPPHTAQPNVRIITPDFVIPGLDRKRTVRLYLPPGYETSSKRYPVLYMHDGQNLFDDATAYAGEWGIDESLNELAKSRQLELIVVGIDNGGEKRMNELNAWDHTRFGKGEGRLYLDFIVKTVKPYIDSHYRSKPGREDTAIMGSSMGGLMSHIAILEYPEVFSRAGIFSPAYWPAPAIFDLVPAKPVPADARLYLTMGGKEGNEAIGDFERMVALLQKSLKTPTQMEYRLIKDDEHNEKAWRAEFPRAVTWLFAPNPAK